LEQLGDRRILEAQALLGAGQADLGQAGPDRRLAGQECRPTGGAALLAVPVRGHRPFATRAVAVGRAVAPPPVVVDARVPPPDVIPPQDQDVRLALRHRDPPLPTRATSGLGPPSRDRRTALRTRRR